MNIKQLQEQLSTAAAEESKGNYAETELRAQQVLRELDSEAQPEQSAEASELLSLRAEVTRLLGWVAWRRGSNHSALEYSQVAQSLAEFSGNAAVQAKVMNTIGLVYNSLSDYPKALEYYSRALSQFEEGGDKRGVAMVTGNIGGVYRLLSDYPKALEYYARGLSLYEEVGEQVGMATVTGNIGNVYHSLSDYPQALEYYSRALFQHAELGDKVGVARVAGNIGNVYQSLSDYPKALEYYVQALAQYEDLGDKVGVAKVTGNIGGVYYALSDYPKALEFCARALSQHEEFGDKAGVATVTGNIGLVYQSLSDYPKALEYFARALSQLEEVGNKSGVATVTGNIGTVYLSLSDYSKALEFLSRGLKLQDELGLRSQAANTRSALGDLYASEANPERDEAKSEEYLRESIAASEQLGTKNYYAHKVLSEIYERQQRWQDFAFHLKKYHELKDAVQSEEAAKTAVLMEQRRQIAEREKEIAIAKAAADAELKATRGLLDAVLPTSIATRMISGEKRIADYFPSVSILFADIVGFTEIATEVPPDVVVDFLNHVFDVYDDIMKRHGCEKIKTIGDGYMAISGAPLTCDDHAERIARAAIEMQNDIVLPPEIRDFLPRDSVFNIRIGIHTGAAVCGVIGKERFVWDAYSDAVNTASRMESSGEPGKIHVSKEFAWLLRSRQKMTKSAEEFQLVDRGDVEIKGKGMMRTYFLEKA